MVGWALDLGGCYLRGDDLLPVLHGWLWWRDGSDGAYIGRVYCHATGLRAVWTRSIRKGGVSVNHALSYRSLVCCRGIQR